jgi:hypothetical protein
MKIQETNGVFTKDMTKKIFSRLKNPTTAIAIACALAAVTSQSTDACGPFAKIAVFVNGFHPDLPMNRFAAGELGIINPTYARSYLVVAYRYLAGIKNPPEKQKEFVVLWQRRLETLDVSVQDAIANWSTERKKVYPAKGKDQDAYETNGYYGYLTYNADAFNTATKTLRSKIEKYGANDERVKQWLKTQDTVFGISSSTNSDNTASTSNSGTAGDTAGNTGKATAGNTSSDTTAGGTSADGKSDADAAYQLACKDFYSQKYEDAVEKFKAIAADSSSPWQQWANYLAARAYCRQATLGDEIIVEDLKKAKELVDKVIVDSKDNPRMLANAKRLNSFLEYRLNPGERARQVVAALTSEGTQEDLTEALGDYTILLDKVLEKQTSNSPTSMRFDDQHDGNIQPGEGAAKEFNTSNLLDSSAVSYAALFAITLLGTHRLWWRRRNEDAKLSRNSHIAAALSVSLLSCSLMSCSKNAAPQTSEEKETTRVLAQTPEASGGKLPSPGDVVLDDDMTKWILNFQDTKPEALSKALDQWKKSKSLPWLVSVISKLKATDARKAEVVAEAAKISKDSPAYLTLEFHQIRLLAEENKPKEAASRLNALLAEVGSKLPPSTRNALFEMGVSCAGSLAEFVKLAAPSPAVVTWDYDSNELPDNDSESEPGPARLKPIDKYLNYTGCLTGEAAEIVNNNVPLGTFAALASNTTLPAAVRFDLAQAGWVRSVMLKNEKMATTLSPVLAKLRPQLSKSLTTYDAASSGTEKEFAGLTAILRNPGMRPYVTPGLVRETAFDKIDNYRNNWWDAEQPQAARNPYMDNGEEAEKEKKPSTAAFLTPAEAEQGSKESAAIAAQGTAPNVLAQRVLALSKAKPKDPRLAEMLHLVVTTTRYGNTDDETTALSKQAYQALHKNFPNDPWTKKTKFWF